jgi:hypothetical protein
LGHRLTDRLHGLCVPCAGGVQVPDDQRMNAEKKLRQMVLLEESMYSIRMRFNRRYLLGPFVSNA